MGRKHTVEIRGEMENLISKKELSRIPGNKLVENG